MTPLLAEIRRSSLLWLLVFVPLVRVGHRLVPDAHSLLFVLSVLAIVPLAALLSHATESVAASVGRNPWMLGAAMVLLGALLSALTIALGG